MSPPEAVAALAFFGGGFWVLRPIAAAVAKRISGEHRPRTDDAGRLLAPEREVQKLDRGH